MNSEKRSFSVNIWSDDVSHHVRLPDEVVQILRREGVKMKEYALYETEAVLEKKENSYELTLSFKKISEIKYKPYGKD